jgi:hypothetical protein
VAERNLDIDVLETTGSEKSLGVAVYPISLLSSYILISFPGLNTQITQCHLLSSMKFD